MVVNEFIKKPIGSITICRQRIYELESLQSYFNHGFIDNPFNNLFVRAPCIGAHYNVAFVRPSLFLCKATVDKQKATHVKPTKKKHRAAR
jgi:hypothetical protein